MRKNTSPSTTTTIVVRPPVPPRPTQASIARARQKQQNKASKATLQRALNNALSSLPAGTFEAGGSLLGSMFGPQTSVLGAALGRGMARLVGHGDYQLVMNSLIKPGSERTKLQAPVFGRGGQVTRIQKKEFLGMITTSATAGQFNVQQFRLNPGSPKTFPLLSSSYSLSAERWRPLGCAVLLRSIASEYTNTVTLGAWGAAVDYDNVDVPYTTRQQLEEASQAVSAKISDDILMGVECDLGFRSTESLLIRHGAVPPNDSPNLYDLGILEIFTVGCPSTSAQIGEAWVVTDFELIDQQLIGGPSGTQCFNYDYVANSTLANLSTTDPLGILQPGYVQSGTLPMAPSNNGSNDIFTFPDWFSGVVEVESKWYFTTAPTTFTAPTFTLGGNLIACRSAAANTAGTVGDPRTVSNYVSGLATPNTVSTVTQGISAAGNNLVISKAMYQVLPASTPGGNTLTLSSNSITVGSGVLGEASFHLRQLSANPNAAAVAATVTAPGQTTLAASAPTTMW